MLKIRFKIALCFIIMCSVGCSEKNEEKAPWVSLLENNTLNGWTVKGGNAIYEVADGVITGTTVMDTPNSFLTTIKTYDDFILELDFKVDPAMNSGVQIRSNSFVNYQDGKVHRYQIEIDPSNRAWSAGVYDEARRGWLNTLDKNPKAQDAFKKNDWNHYRIEAIGDTIKTWINKVPAAHLIDDKTASGFIGLQVHSIATEQKEGTVISWKNIRILTERLEEFYQKTEVISVGTKNQLTVSERENGWEMLWDGETTNGWRGSKLDGFPENGWEIKDGDLTVLSTGGKESVGGGDIVTEELYGDFELKVDFKLSPGANSGIKYYVDPDINQGQGSAIGLEYQVLDDDLHPDAKKGNHEGSRTVSSLYDLIQADLKKPINAIGEWNSAYILSENNHVEHWLNGSKVLEYERGSADFLKLVAASKYKKWPNFGLLEEGHLLLQDHGDRVSYKNIKIKAL